MTPKNNSWIIKPLVPEEVYTDREEFIDYFHHAALEAVHRRTMSTVLLGQRRMGKTEIFKRVVNRLFFEQDRNDPKAVVPVFYSFPEVQEDKITFALDYIENFLRHYVGFHTSQPSIIYDKIGSEKLFSLIDSVRDRLPSAHTLEMVLDWYSSVKNKDVRPEFRALLLPRWVADIEDSTIVVFLDEFQNTRMPEYKFNIAGLMQEPVESPNCPHFVTGSAMSILSREIIGRGALFGRFRGMEIAPLSQWWSAELALKASRYYRANLSETMAPIVAERCGGNPFYINAVVQQSADQRKPISDEDSLNHILAFDISSGFIWGELHDQVTRWIKRINEHHITKWILYLSAIEQEDRIRLDRIQKELKEREGKTVSIDMIQEVLVKLSRGDLIEYLELGGTFRKIDDPILLEFLKVWGRIEVEGQNRGRVELELESQYGKMKKRISEYKGYLAEVHMSQVLLNGQRKVLKGGYFNSKTDIHMPNRFVFVRHRMRIGSGKGKEIDLIGASGQEIWVCQSKWVVGHKIGVSVLQELMAQVEAVEEDFKPNGIRMWVFAHDGLTAEAEEFAEKHGILWSCRKEFDALLVDVGLRPLPELENA